MVFAVSGLVVQPIKISVPSPKSPGGQPPPRGLTEAPSSATHLGALQSSLKFGALRLQDENLPYLQPLPHDEDLQDDGLYLNQTLLTQHPDFTLNDNFFNPLCHDLALRRMKLMIDRINTLQVQFPEFSARISQELSKQEARDTLRMSGIRIAFAPKERLFCALRLAKEWFMDTLHNPFDKFKGNSRGWNRPTEIVFGTFDLICLPLTLLIMPVLGLVYGSLTGNPGVRGLTNMMDEIDGLRDEANNPSGSTINPGL